jgi:hypothetical protein
VGEKTGRCKTLYAEEMGLTAWSKVRLEKVTGSMLLMKLQTVY